MSEPAPVTSGMETIREALALAMDELDFLRREIKRAAQSLSENDTLKTAKILEGLKSK